MNKNLFAVLTAIMFVSLLGCSQITQKVEKKTLTGSNLIKKQSKRQIMSTSKYKISIDTGSTVKCTGTDVVIDMYSDQTIDMRGSANCGFLASLVGQGNINVGESAMDSSTLTDTDNLKGGKLYGIINRSPNTPKDASGNVPEGGAYFEPPRPNIINPLLDERTLNDLVDMENYEEESFVTVGSYTDYGTISVNFLDFKGGIPSGVNQSVAPQSTHKANKGRILHYKIKASGFTGIAQKGKFMLYDSREMWMGTNPVVIYKMVIKSPLRDLIDTSKASWIQNLVTNNGQNMTTITLTLQAYTPTNNTGDDDDDDDDNEDNEDNEDDEDDN